MQGPRETQTAGSFAADPEKSQTSRARSLARRLLRVALLLPVAAYLLLCWFLLIGGDRRLTFQPDPRHTPPEAARLSNVTERVLTTPDGERLIAWSAKAQPGKPTILYFHGNGDALIYRSGRIAAFQAEGYGVLMIAYRGYSGSTGKPSEEAIVADARLAYDTLRAEGLAPTEIVIYGESMGTSVAAQVARRAPSLAVILEAPFTSMVDAWRQFVPLVPVRALIRDRFETDRVISEVRAPILIMHGRRDRLVGFELGRRLYALAPDPKRFEEFPQARHTDLYDYNAIAAVRRFIDDVRAGRIAQSQAPTTRH